MTASPVSQVLPRENNGAYEKETRRRILEKKNMTVVCAYEIFKDLNVIRRGAGALLNARLIPVVEEFFAAVHHVLEERQIPLPFSDHAQRRQSGVGTIFRPVSGGDPAVRPHGQCEGGGGADAPRSRLWWWIWAEPPAISPW